MTLAVQQGAAQSGRNGQGSIRMMRPPGTLPDRRTTS